MRKRCCVGLALIAAALQFGPRPALAHKLIVFAQAEGQKIVGEAYYRGGGSLRGASVAIFGHGGEALGQTTTNQEGKFVFVPTVRGDYRFVVDAGDGHAESYTVSAAELPKDLGGPAPPGQGSADLSALQAQIAQLRKDVERYQAEIRLRDVLGGLGYILGLTGLAFYILGSRRKGA